MLLSMPVALLVMVHRGTCRGVWSLKEGLSTMLLRCQPFEQGLGENDDIWKIELLLFHGCLTRVSI
jgi:hypothetical protein